MLTALLAGAAPAYQRECAGCHVATAATAGLPQGVRALGGAGDEAARRFVAEHLMAMTGRAPRPEEAAQIVREIRGWDAARPAGR